MGKLGIDFKILIGQIVNFVILLFLLKKFAYKPFLNILEKRKTKIEEGVRKSEEAEKSLQKIRALEGEIRENGEQKARVVIKEAEARAEARAKDILALAEKEKEKVIQKARETAEKEAAEEKKKREKEMVELAFLASEKFLKEKIDGEKDKKFLEDIVSGLK